MLHPFKILTSLLLVAAAGCDTNLDVNVSNGGQIAVIETDAAATKLRLIVSANLTNDPEFLVQWEAGADLDAAAGYTLHLADSATCETPVKTFTLIPGHEIKLGDVADGSYFLCLYGKDKKDNTIAADSNGLPLTIDRTAPVVEAIGTLYKNSTFSLQPSISDAHAVTSMWSKKTGAGEVTFSDSATPTITITGDDTYELMLTAADTTGNIATQTYTIIYDTVAPLVNAGPDVNKNAAFTSAATATGADILQWSQVSGPGVVTFADATSAITGITASVDGTYVLRLTAKDRAGNESFDEFSLVWKTSGPQLTSLAQSGVAADGYVNISDQASATPIFTLNAIAYDSAEYSTLLTEPFTCDANTAYGQPTIPLATDIPSDGKFGICVHLSDLTGNHIYAASDIIERDTVLPGSATFTLANEAIGGYVNAAEINSAQALVSLTGSGFTAEFSVPLNNGALTCDDGETYTAAVPALNQLPNANGAYAVCAKLTDAAGNIAYEKSPQVHVDLTAPAVDAGENITASGSANITTATSDGDVLLWEKVSGPGTITFGSASAVATTAGASTQGTYVLRLTATDVAGNSASDTMTYIFDSTPPAFTSLAETGDASDGYINDAEKAGMSALWALNADGYTVADYTQPLDETAACDVSQGYNESSIARAVDFTAGDKAYVICVRLTDAAGNITYGKSDAVTRDIVAPIVSVGADLLANTTKTVNASVTGATTYQWSDVNASGHVSFTAATASSTNISADADGSYDIRLTATDAAGNNASDELQFTWDATSPNLGSFVKTGDASDGYVNDAEKNGITALWSLTGSSGHDSVSFTTALSNPASVTCDENQSYSESTIITAPILTHLMSSA